MIQKNNLLEQISNKRTSLEKKQNLDYLVNSSFLEVHRPQCYYFKMKKAEQGIQNRIRKEKLEIKD